MQRKGFQVNSRLTTIGKQLGAVIGLAVGTVQVASVYAEPHPAVLEAESARIATVAEATRPALAVVDQVHNQALDTGGPIDDRRLQRAGRGKRVPIHGAVVVRVDHARGGGGIRGAGIR